MAQPDSLAAPQDDAALIAAWREGDERAATELVRRHARALARYLAGAGAPELELEDLVQEALIRAFRSIQGFRGQCRFRTWLLTIGGNVLKDHGRRVRQRHLVPLPDDVEASDGTPHDAAVARDVAQRLEEGLTKLPRLQREVFLLRAQQGLDYEDIAAALHTTPGAARVHYHHAVKRLKEYVE